MDFDLYKNVCDLADSVTAWLSAKVQVFTEDTSACVSRMSETFLEQDFSLYRQKKDRHLMEKSFTIFLLVIKSCQKDNDQSRGKHSYVGFSNTCISGSGLTGVQLRLEEGWT